MGKISKEQVQKLQDQQDNPRYHPYTCCSYDGCERDKQPNWGALIPIEDCWICPCGKYKQEYRGEISN
jgi:hypothetical protein